MSDNTTVKVSAAEFLALAKSFGALAATVNPGVAGGIALVTGVAELLRNTVIPAVRHLSDDEYSIAEQATIQAESAAERARVGAPPSQID